MHLLWIVQYNPLHEYQNISLKVEHSHSCLAAESKKKERKKEKSWNWKFWETDALPCQEEKIKKITWASAGEQECNRGPPGVRVVREGLSSWAKKNWRRKNGKNNNVSSLLLRGYTRSFWFSTRVTPNTPPTICASRRLSAGRPSSAERRWWAGVTVSRARSRHTVSAEPRK